MDAQGLTNTAQVIQHLAAMTPHEIFNYVLAGLCMLAGSVVGQHVIESLIANVPLPWYIPKALLPSILSSLVGVVMKMTGVDGATAAEASLVLSGLIHTVNQTRLAADLPSKVGVVAQAVGSNGFIDLIKAVIATHEKLSENPQQVTAQVAHTDAVTALAAATK